MYNIYVLCFVLSSSVSGYLDKLKFDYDFIVKRLGLGPGLWMGMGMGNGNRNREYPQSQEMTV